MVFLVSKCLFFNLRYSSYSFEEPRVLGNLSTLFQEFDMLLEVMRTGEITNVT